MWLRASRKKVRGLNNQDGETVCLILRSRLLNCISLYAAYDYDTTYIHAVPAKDLTDVTIINTTNVIFEDMEKKEHKPRLSITDNQAVAPLKRYHK